MSNLTRLIVVLTICIVLAAGMVWQRKTATSEINCQARTVIHNGDHVISLKTVLHMDDDDNFFELLISYVTPHQAEPLKIHRVVNFSYDREDDIYKMFSDVTNDNVLAPSVRNELNDLLPDFYLMPQRGLRFKIDKTSNGNYVILNDRLPVFLCVPIES